MKPTDGVETLGHNTYAFLVKANTLVGNVDKILHYDFMNDIPSSTIIRNIKSFLGCDQDTIFETISTPRQGEVECLHRVILCGYLLASHSSYDTINWNYYLPKSHNYSEFGYAVYLFCIASVFNNTNPSIKVSMRYHMNNDTNIVSSEDQRYKIKVDEIKEER